MLLFSYVFDMMTAFKCLELIYLYSSGQSDRIDCQSSVSVILNIGVDIFI